MDRLRSVRAFVIVAVVAMILAVISPFSAMTQMVGQMQASPVAASQPAAMDCVMCPKANIAPAGCTQANCQVTAIEVEFIHVPVAEPIRYRLATVTRPVEWPTVPPVSPG